MPRSGQSWDRGRFALRPSLEPFREHLLQLGRLEAFPTVEDLTAWVEEGRSQRAPEVPPLKFVSLPPKPRRAKRAAVEIAALYDARITCAREVPCLNSSYHDLFNALMFKVFPRSKRTLHARQYEALLGWANSAFQQLPGRRTREQDALTLFDEGGSVVVCAAPLREAFAGGARLPLCTPGAAASVVVFGHALLEHLSEGQLGLRSTARILFVEERRTGQALLDLVDESVARLLQDPARFRVPDADAVVSFDQDGTVSFRRFDPAVRRARAGSQPALFG